MNERQKSSSRIMLRNTKPMHVPCDVCAELVQLDQFEHHKAVCYRKNRATPLGVIGSSRTQKADAQGSVICYICGRPFGSKSMEIHEVQCMKRWEIENSKLPKALRQKRPQRFDFDQSLSKESSSKATPQFEQCLNCRHTFRAEEIDEHQRKCSQSNSKQAPLTNRLRSTGPVFVICYICGRKYGSKSIEIHEPQCLEKWKLVNADLPRHLRKSIPMKPQFDSNGFQKSSDFDAYNEAAYYSMTAQYLECKNCGRTFAPDRLAVHQRSCVLPVARINRTAPSAMSNTRTTKVTNQRVEVKQPDNRKYRVERHFANQRTDPLVRSENMQLEQCPVCSRKFSSDRIQKHMNACQVANRKRKVFDSTKMRVSGTEAAQFVTMKKRSMLYADSPKPKSNWRQKHEDFIQAIRYAKKLTVVEKSGDARSLYNMPPPPVSSNPDYIQCPICGRRFNQAAGSRHIPRCKDIVNKPKPPPHLRNLSNIQKTSIISLRNYKR